MKEEDMINPMPSAEFRKRYASLKSSTTVTVNGHPIGVWVPWMPEGWEDRAGTRQAAAEGRPIMSRKVRRAAEANMSQAQRDDWLRKINRSR